jgi:hypothetical protein
MGEHDLYPIEAPAGQSPQDLELVREGNDEDAATDHAETGVSEDEAQRNTGGQNVADEQ